MISDVIKRGVSGVYQIVNLVNDKSYIGSSINLYNRYHAHRNKLVNHKHSNKHLEAAYHKYGFDNFKFTVMEYCDDYNSAEQYYLDLYKPEYNKRIEAQNNSGLPVSAATRLKISNTLKVRYQNGLTSYDQKHAQKSVNQFDLTGTFIERFSTTTEAMNKTGVPRDSIRRACSNAEKCNGFQWRFTDSTLPLNNNAQFKKGEGVTLLDIVSGESIDFKSVKACARHFGVTFKVIARVLRRRVIYKKKYTINYQVQNKDGELLETPEADNQQPSIAEM